MMSNSCFIITDASAIPERAEPSVSTASQDAAEQHRALCQQLLAREQAAPGLAHQLGPAFEQTAA